MRIIVSTAEGAAPFAPDAAVVEDDTFRVLGADPVAKERYEDVGRLLERAAGAEPEAPGSVLVREGTPPIFHAIVHDLEREPSWREEWVVDALYRIMKEADRRRISGLSLPVLGSVHGSLGARRFAQLLRAVLLEARPARLEKIWVVVAAGTPREEFDALREFELEVRGERDFDDQ